MERDIRLDGSSGITLSEDGLTDRHGNLLAGKDAAAEFAEECGAASIAAVWDWIDMRAEAGGISHPVLFSSPWAFQKTVREWIARKFSDDGSDDGEITEFLDHAALSWESPGSGK